MVLEEKWIQEINIGKENSRMEYFEKASFIISEQLNKDILKMENWKEEALKLNLMEHSMKVHLFKVYLMDSAKKLIRKEIIMRVNSKMDYLMVMVNSKESMEDIIKANGLMIYMMEKDYMCFPRVNVIVGISN